MTGPITAGDTSIPKTRQPQAGLQPRDAGQRLGGLGWPRAGKDRPNAGRRLAGFLPGCGVHGGAQGAPREAASRTPTWDLRAAESAAASCVWGSPATAGDATNPSAPLPPCTPGHRADGRPPAGGVYRQDRHLLGRERRQLRHQRGLGASQVQLQAVPGNPAPAAAPAPPPGNPAPHPPPLRAPWLSSCREAWVRAGRATCLLGRAGVVVSSCDHGLRPGADLHAAEVLARVGERWLEAELHVCHRWPGERRSLCEALVAADQAALCSRHLVWSRQGRRVEVSWVGS